MPIYDYECPKCNHKFEHITLRASEKGPEGCPECGNNELLRIMSGGQKVIYKTDGFHATDYPTVRYGKDG